MGERLDHRYCDDLWEDDLSMLHARPYDLSLIRDLKTFRADDIFFVGIDPIDPITPKSGSDDLIFKTTPKFFL